MKITKNDFCYILGVIAMIVRTYINNSILSEKIPIYDLILLPFIGIVFLCKFLNSKYSKKELILIISIILFCLYTSLKTDKFVVLMSGLALVTIKDINIEKVIKAIFYTNVCLLFFFTLSYLMELILNPTNINFNFFYNGQVRHTFYFNHPNMYANMLFWTLAEYMFINKDNKYILKYIYVFVFGIFVVYFTKTRTTMICILLLLIFNLPLLNTDTFYRFFRIFTKHGFWLLTITFIVIVYNYQWLYEHMFRVDR